MVMIVLMIYHGIWGQSKYRIKYMKHKIEDIIYYLVIWFCTSIIVLWVIVLLIRVLIFFSGKIK